MQIKHRQNKYYLNNLYKSRKIFNIYFIKFNLLLNILYKSEICDKNKKIFIIKSQLKKI
jgi:hypothetical protein